MSEIAALRAKDESLGAEHQQAVDGLWAELRAGLSSLESKLMEISARTEADHKEHRVSLESKLMEISARIEADHKEHRVRRQVLEQLIIDSSLPRLPAVERRVNDMAAPVVSVILPTRNRAHCVADAIASVQAQHFTSWELIIVDDGSTDNTAAVVRPYLDDQRIRYVERAAAGASAARNQGIALASGVLMAYLDSDNIWYPDFLSAAVTVFTADPAVDLVYGMLVTEHHALDGTRLLWRAFDRDELLASNYIDLNVVVHRKSLVARYGGFDEKLGRLNDWDVILRFTEHAPAHALPVLAARYRVCDDTRITTTMPFGPEYVAVQRKWYPPNDASRRPRVLYLLWQYPQLSETYIEAEIRCMLRWGVEVEVWRARGPASPHPTSVPIHDGPLADTVRCVRPDVLHVHWMGFAEQQAGALAQLGVPVTLRLHGFDTTAEQCHMFLAQPWVGAIYGFPQHLRLIEGENARLRAVPAAFDTMLFRPHRDKERRLVLRASAALRSKDLPLFIELADRLPQFQFVLAGITCTDAEEYVEVIRQTKSRCEVLFDVSRQQIARLMERAGIYVHTAIPPGAEFGTPIGMPISIAEAMATGAHVLVRDLPELRAYVGDAGSVYRDVDDAAEIITSTARWTEQEWRKAWRTSVDRAFMSHADELALRPIFEDWCAIVRNRTCA
jgi:glycosyltransferase involved in cell wall biosynthesis